MLIENSSQTTRLDEEIIHVLSSMKGIGPETKEYGVMADQLVKLYEIREALIELHLKDVETNNKGREAEATWLLREVEAELKRKEIDAHGKLSLETLATISAHLLGILAILNFEKTGVIVSRAFGLIRGVR